MDIVTVLVVVLALAAGLAVGALIGSGLLRREQVSVTEQLGAATTATAQAVAPVKDSLDRFDARLRELEASRVEWHSQLRQQVESVRVTGESLRRETASLSTALRRPQVRGRWGEMHLRRAVEVAGLVDRCDFTEQVSLRGGDATLRPDLVVHLVGGKEVVVDSKVPLDAFLDATAADDQAAAQAHLVRHARQLRTHIDALSAKTYWKRLDATPEFVVLFVPGEAFLSQALETEPTLLEYAAGRQVVLATPTTLIALLRTVAYAWGQEVLAESAREVQAVGRELYERLGTLGGHVDKVGRSLTAAVSSYNSAVASLETRVLVSARRMRDLSVTEESLDGPRPVEAAVRPIVAPELLLEPRTPELLLDDPSPAPGDAARRAG
jgi:DNA recombination protein RmuC